MLSKLQKFKEEREQGFTLIELLVVILIIGILSAIAIPAFLNQRKAAVETSLESDLTSSAKHIETWSMKQGAKVADLPTDLTTDAVSGELVATGIESQTLSKGTNLAFAGSNDGYCIQGWNKSAEHTGDGNFLAYDSLAGGMLKDDSGAKSCPSTVLTQPMVSADGSDGSDGLEDEDFDEDLFRGKITETDDIWDWTVGGEVIGKATVTYDASNGMLNIDAPSHINDTFEFKATVSNMDGSKTINENVKLVEGKASISTGFLYGDELKRLGIQKR